ncbi:hypothetical protein ACFQRK_00030 [Parapedobacter sp. GCM10030251]|uniref:hypothetical protein n=1 Tax=Parapedobacter sp. GCM10030251 TaxID=3273419 RepID=UPI003618CD46
MKPENFDWNKTISGQTPVSNGVASAYSFQGLLRASLTGRLDATPLPLIYTYLNRLVNQ